MEIARATRSRAAEAALVFMKDSLQQTELAYERTRGLRNEFRDLAKRLGSIEAPGLGRAASTLERSLSGRSLVSSLKPLLPVLGNLITTVGVGVASIKGYQDAPSDSARWKVAHGIAAGATSFAVGKLNPIIALTDASIVNYGKAFGIKQETTETLTIGNFYENSTKSFLALTQGLVTGDTNPLNKAHQHNMSANGNIVLRGYAHIGEALSNSALVDKTMTNVADWWHDVPSDMRSSSSWWEALKSDADSISDIRKGVVDMIKSSIKPDDKG